MELFKLSALPFHLKLYSHQPTDFVDPVWTCAVFLPSSFLCLFFCFQLEKVLIHSVLISTIDVPLKIKKDFSSVEESFHPSVFL